MLSIFYLAPHNYSILDISQKIHYWVSNRCAGPSLCICCENFRNPVFIVLCTSIGCTVLPYLSYTTFNSKIVQSIIFIDNSKFALASI